MEKNSDRLTRYFREAYEAKGKTLPGRKRNTVIAVGVHDPISPVAASAVAHEIYKDETPWALQVSGFGVAGARLLLPDTGEIGADELLLGTKAICDAVLKRFSDTMIMGDLDHGYGGPDDAAEFVGKAIRLGIAGFNLEDQQYVINEETMKDLQGKIEEKFGKLTADKYFLKSCGHVGSKKVLIPGRIGGGKVVLPKEMMVKKLERVSAMRDSLEGECGHVAINARTDVFSTYPLSEGEEAIQDAIDRANAYLEAGADIIFHEAVPPFEGIEQEDAIKRLIKETHGPTSFNALRGGRTKKPLMADGLSAMGAARMSLPIASIEAQIRVMTRAYASIFTSGTNVDIPTLGFGITKDFLGWTSSLKEMQKKPHEVAKQGGEAELEALIKNIEGSYKSYVASMLEEK